MTFSSVLLPAPFSPISAWTSPGTSSRSTPSSATVAPKRLRRPASDSTGSVQAAWCATLLQVFRDGWLEEALHLGRVDVLVGDDLDARVDQRCHFLALEVLDGGLHREVAHLERVLQHEAVHLALVHRLDEHR